jgi:pyruvate dehydrogenase E1 component alpha subunit
VRGLPVVYVCENNQYAQYTAIARTTAVDDLARRADGYGIPGLTVDGNDAVAVHQAAEAAVERARSGEGPTFLHLRTYRFGGHFVGDAEEYRTKEEVEGWRELDPILRLEAVLDAEGVLDESGRTEVWDAVGAEVAEAERFAEESPYPDEAEALEGVFT